MKVSSKLISDLENKFNEINKNKDIKFIIRDSDIKNKLYIFRLTKKNKCIDVFWNNGRLNLTENDKKFTKDCEKLNSDIDLLRACREMDKVVDEQATRPVLGKYFNY